MVGDVAVEIPLHLGGGEEEAAAEELIGPRTPARVGDREDRQLESGASLGVCGGELGDDAGEVAAGALAADGDAVGGGAEVGGVVADVAESGDGIVDRSREGFSGARR
ncbi:hypothetical protein GCM10028815_26450 [Mariniluteicoccus flavus]